MESSFEREKNSGKFCTKIRKVPIGQEFQLNATSPFFNENMQTVYSEDIEKCGKLYNNKIK